MTAAVYHVQLRQSGHLVLLHFHVPYSYSPYAHSASLRAGVSNYATIRPLTPPMCGQEEANPMQKMKSVTVGTSAAALYSLLSDTTLAYGAQAIAVQLDAGAGADTLAIGDSGVSPTNCGRKLVASETWEPQLTGEGGIYLKDVWLVATASVQVNVTVVTR